MSAETITAPVAPLRIGAARTTRHSLALAGRNITKLRKNITLLADAILTPVLFLLIFVYLYGGAIAHGADDAYLRTLVPGIMVMTVFQASIGIGASLNADAATGIFDRFRTMPIARSAPLIGAVLADIVRYVVCLTVVVALSLVMGYRITTDPASALAAFGLLLGFALCFSWISVFIGMTAKSPASVMGLMTALIVPLTFASNVAVPSGTMPGWLQAWSHINPVSLLSDTMRGLLNGGAVAHPLLGSLCWMAGMVAVFFPLAMRAYRRNAG
jgi:oleandomycin transport system permease protein